MFQTWGSTTGFNSGQYQPRHSRNVSHRQQRKIRLSYQQNRPSPALVQRQVPTHFYGYGWRTRNGKTVTPVPLSSAVVETTPPQVPAIERETAETLASFVSTVETNVLQPRRDQPHQQRECRAEDLDDFIQTESQNPRPPTRQLNNIIRKRRETKAQREQRELESELAKVEREFAKAKQRQADATNNRLPPARARRIKPVKLYVSPLEDGGLIDGERGYPSANFSSSHVIDTLEEDDEDMSDSPQESEFDYLYGDGFIVRNDEDVEVEDVQPGSPIVDLVLNKRLSDVSDVSEHSFQPEPEAMDQDDQESMESFGWVKSVVVEDDDSGFGWQKRGHVERICEKLETKEVVQEIEEPVSMLSHESTDTQVKSYYMSELQYLQKSVDFKSIPQSVLSPRYDKYFSQDGSIDLENISVHAIRLDYDNLCDLLVEYAIQSCVVAVKDVEKIDIRDFLRDNPFNERSCVSTLYSDFASIPPEHGLDMWENTTIPIEIVPNPFARPAIVSQENDDMSVDEDEEVGLWEEVANSDCESQISTTESHLDSGNFYILNDFIIADSTKQSTTWFDSSFMSMQTGMIFDKVDDPYIGETNFHIGLKKIQCNVASSYTLNEKSLAVLNSFVNHVLNVLLENSFYLTVRKGRMTANLRDLQFAVMGTFQGEIGKHAVHALTVTCNIIHTSKSEDDLDDLLHLAFTRDKLAEFLEYRSRMAVERQSFAAALSTVVEYLASELMYVSATACARRNEERVISPRDVKLGVTHDTELYEFFQKTKVMIPAAGGMEFFHPILHVLRK